jgi:Tol biopolymer transport system component
MKKQIAVFLVSAVLLAGCGLQTAVESGPPADETASGAVDLTGEWLGTSTEAIESGRVFDVILDINHDLSTRTISGAIRFIGRADEPLEIYSVEGDLIGTSLQLNGSGGQFFDFLIEGQTLVGNASWECFGCNPWGELSLSFSSANFPAANLDVPTAAVTVETLNIPTAPSGLIVFASDMSGDYEIYTVSPDGSNLTQLTFRPDTVDYAPQWSPDGRTIAFFSAFLGSSFGEIMLMDENGNNLHPLFEQSNDPTVSIQGGYPFWSPDGSRVAFSSPTGLETVSVDGSDLREIVSISSDYLGFITDPRWSPDGTHLTFHAQSSLKGQSTTFSIYTVSADGSVLSLIYNNRNEDSLLPKWLSNDEIIFTSYNNLSTERQRNVFSVRISGGAPSNLSIGFFTNDIATQPGLGFVILHGGTRVARLDLDTKAITILAETENPSIYTNMALSPDGFWLVTELEMEHSIVINTSTGEAIDLPISGQVAGYSWRP